MNERPRDAAKIPRAEFDALARDREAWEHGPFVSSFGGGEFDPYIPPSRRTVWGRLADGRAVWADHE
jgi:hypothetical protein